MKRYHRRQTTRWKCDCAFADDGGASWYSVCQVPMVEWRLDCENCPHLTVVGLHDTGPRCVFHIRKEARFREEEMGTPYMCATQTTELSLASYLCQRVWNAGEPAPMHYRSVITPVIDRAHVSTYHVTFVAVSVIKSGAECSKEPLIASASSFD